MVLEDRAVCDRNRVIYRLSSRDLDLWPLAHGIAASVLEPAVWKGVREGKEGEDEKREIYMARSGERRSNRVCVS
jgi:hypothetical protein